MAVLAGVHSKYKHIGIGDRAVFFYSALDFGSGRGPVTL